MTTTIAAVIEDRDRLRGILEDCREYFSERADAEYFTDSPEPCGNEEMRMLVAIEEVLK